MHDRMNAASAGTAAPTQIRPVRKAVIPVGGLGTRFLPATKAMPKEMLPVVDRPVIQYAVEEAMAAGIEQIVFVTGRGKSCIEDHFDVSFELEARMAARGSPVAAIAGTRHAPGRIVHVRQQEPLGLGHAVWCARDIVGDEPFAVLLPDELMPDGPGLLSRMVSAYSRLGGNVLGTIEVDAGDVSQYGIISPGQRHGELIEIAGLVEKPDPAVAPSRVAVAGRYILQPEIMALLENQAAGAGGEVQLTDALASLVGRLALYAVPCHGRRFDCGSKAGWLMANIALAIDEPEIGPSVRKFISALGLARSASESRQEAASRPDQPLRADAALAERLEAR
jgi:UTP--glucose-1-phosphate uridylyltransferase